MAIFILQATINETPDPTLAGDLSVTSPSNTGHAATLTSCSSFANPPLAVDSAGQDRSCRWRVFTPVITNNIVSINLKFNWSLTGSLNTNIGTPSDLDASALAESSFLGEYTLNNGSSFLSAIVRNYSVSGGVDSIQNDSGSVNISIPNTTPISQIFVRDQLSTFTSCTAGNVEAASASASITVTISSIQLEVVILDNIGLLVMM